MDIKNHKWFSGDFDWEELASRSCQPSFIPEISNPADTSNFADYPDSPTQAEEVSEEADPFLNW